MRGSKYPYFKQKANNMKWEIINDKPNIGDVRFKTKFAWWPTIVLSKLTMTDHRIWLELYIEEQEYVIDILINEISPMIGKKLNV